MENLPDYQPISGKAALPHHPITPSSYYPIILLPHYPISSCQIILLDNK
jgi:hypothetical protein